MATRGARPSPLRLAADREERGATKRLQSSWRPATLHRKTPRPGQCAAKAAITRPRREPRSALPLGSSGLGRRRLWSGGRCAADKSPVIGPVLVGIALGHIPILGARRQPGGMRGEHPDPGLAEIERLEQRRDPCVLLIGLIEEAGAFQRIVVAVQAAEEVDDERRRAPGRSATAGRGAHPARVQQPGNRRRG